MAVHLQDERINDSWSAIRSLFVLCIRVVLSTTPLCPALFDRRVRYVCVYMVRRVVSSPLVLCEFGNVRPCDWTGKCAFVSREFVVIPASVQQRKNRPRPNKW